MRALGVILVALLGCRGDERQPAAKKQETAPAAKQQPADPWKVERDSNAPPDLAERHRVADEACPTVTGAFFYRVEKGAKVSYLLGTRHIGVPLAKFPPSVLQAIDSAKLAVFETPPDKESAFDPPKVDLRTELGPELWAKYERLVGTAMAKGLERAAPSTAMLAVGTLYDDIGAFLDREIVARVQAAKIPTAGLESHELQRGLITKILDMRMFRAMLRQTKDRAEIRDDTRKGLAEYCNGTKADAGLSDENRKDLMAEGYTKAELDQIEEELVYRRNNDWIPKLEKLFEQGNVFVAVGAGHLRGERGVVTLLEKRGLKLTRITK